MGSPRVRDQKTQTDFVLSSDRKFVENCEVITKMDVSSDHRMVRARVEINEKLMRLKKIQNQKPLKLHLRVLGKLVTPFRIGLKNRFDTLKGEESSIEKMYLFIKESMTLYKTKHKIPQPRRVLKM